MRRALIVIALGIIFLILITWIGTFLDSIVLHRATPQVQTAQAGPYKVIFQVNPNPPLITQPATLLIQLLSNASQQPLTNAHVTLMSNMETMDMELDKVEAQSQGNGTYVAKVQFSMSGTWKVQVVVALPGEKQMFNTSFEVVAQ